MGLEKHYCPCATEKPHKGGHYEKCCSCLKCIYCGRWVQTKFLDVHNALADCTVLAIPSQSPADPVLDSLEIALSEVSSGKFGLGLELAEELGLSTFRASVREALQDLMEHEELLDCPYIGDTNTEVWQYLLNIIFAQKAEDEEIVAMLLNLFPKENRSGDLEAKLWVMLSERDKLFPAHTNHP